MIRLIVAYDSQSGIAKHGFQPWKIPDDETYFAAQTKLYGGNIIMGSTTFRTLKGPLVGRQNYILTSNATPIAGTQLVHDLPEFLKDLGTRDLWVIGGANVYDQFMSSGLVDEIYITSVQAAFGCDQFFPKFEETFQLRDQSAIKSQNGFNFIYEIYSKNTN